MKHLCLKKNVVKKFWYAVDQDCDLPIADRQQYLTHMISHIQDVLSYNNYQLVTNNEEGHAEVV
jgi:hypothetical protein